MPSGKTKVGGPPGAGEKAPARLRRAERILRDRTGDLAILLEEPYDPGNLSATLRTAEALGLQNLHVVRAEPWHVRRKVTQRAERWLSLHRWRALEPCLEALRREGYRLEVAAVGSGARPMDRVDPRGRLVLAFGNESLGASRALLEAADGAFWIPMLGFTGSLNLTVSVAIAAWEIRRRQIEARGRAGDLGESELGALRETWYRRLAKGRPYHEREFLSWLGKVEPEGEPGPPPDRRETEVRQGADDHPEGGDPLLESAPPGAEPGAPDPRRGR
jgi:tRNA (guanosine-2'-O-)-methyltransferase